MICRVILPEWRALERPDLRTSCDGDFSPEQLEQFNRDFYNIYFYPNHPAHLDPNKRVTGSQIDVFNFVFVDMDLKDGVYKSKEDFFEALGTGPTPTQIIDSGNGVHVYWKVIDLDAMSYLRLTRRLIRYFKTDPATNLLCQLMRCPGYINTKNPEDLKLCEVVLDSRAEYTCEQLHSALPPITPEDEAFCVNHYEKTHNAGKTSTKVDDTIPPKFGELIRTNSEVKDIWSGKVEDRSKADYRLGHILFAHGFSRAEALSVLVNTSKALTRAPVHRVAYAENIVDKIWTFEESPKAAALSMSVREILQRGGDTLKGTRFPCHRWADGTAHGFRLGHVMGLIAGSGVGKTAITLNLFLGFVRNNPDFDHFFVSLEQPANEIAERWKNLCGSNTALHDRVHVLSNYGEDGQFRHLSLEEIKAYLLEMQKQTGRKIGCTVIDHIGALKKKTKDGENQGIIEICHSMKGFAQEVNTFLIMQSQSSREKAGIGDLEIGKDAAYGTVFFEAYCDFVVCLWQPLKRVYTTEGCPTITAFKFAKIRHKNQKLDVIKEDVCYRLFFDPESGALRELTQLEEKSFDYFNKVATNKRKQDRKTDLVEYTSLKTEEPIRAK